MAFDWLAALLTANQELHLKIVVGYPCFYPRIALVAPIPGGEFLCENIIYFAFCIISHQLDGTGKGFPLGRQGHISPTLSSCWCQKPGSCFSNVSQALQNNNIRNHIYSENLKVNFVHVPKAWLWALIQIFGLKLSEVGRFLQYANFEIIFWTARETLVKHPPRHLVLLE